jgi:uracil phosphoribosyltransferase
VDEGVVVIVNKYPNIKTMSVHIIDHPRVQLKLSIMRDNHPSTNKFRELLKEASIRVL